MLKITIRLRCVNRQKGFYIATNSWLQHFGLVKVGHSKQLARRLKNVSYTTCFPDESWSYLATAEVREDKDCAILEGAVLHVLRDFRLKNRELLAVTDGDVLKKVVHDVAEALKITIKWRDSPNYSEEEENAKETSPAEQPSMDPVAVSWIKKAITEADEQLDRIHGKLSPLPMDVASLIEQNATNTIQDVRKTMSNVLSAAPTVEGEVSEDMNDIILSSGEAGKDEDVSLGETDDALCGIVEEEVVHLESFVSQGPIELRDYQVDAVEGVLKDLAIADQTILQMACRCGKTPVAFEISRKFMAQNSSDKPYSVLYMVPGLALLRQTIAKLYSYGEWTNTDFLLIGSDQRQIYLGTQQSLSMTTDPLAIRSFMGNGQAEKRNLFVISTYQSSHLVNAPSMAFDLSIFDECHRTCGSIAPTRFNQVLLRTPPPGKRLYMTATPSYDTPISMKQRELFGGISYRYYLRSGINTGQVNDFKVRIILGKTGVEDANVNCIAEQLYEAMRLADKILVFCRGIQHSEDLAEELRKARNKPHHARGFEILVAHSKMRMGGAADALRHFCGKGQKILFNCRLFQEGVEVPDLNAVFFAAPRYSPRDIIQSICRPLNRLEGKPPSYVFIPAAFNPNKDPGHPTNLASFSTLVPFTDALMDEDPKLFEYLIDPRKNSYDINILGTRSMKISDNQAQKVLLPSLRRGVRYSSNHTDRLTRAKRLPWMKAFAELHRIVTECGRYPKTNDAWVVGEQLVPFYGFMKYCVNGYKLHLKNDPQKYLEPFQVRDLESLPYWKQYGLEGPYPFREGMETLEKHLEQTNGKPPLVDCHRGGYVGLDATPFERLSGVFMTINQQDGQVLMLPSWKQEILDKICNKWNLKWRKIRLANGKLKAKQPMTFIQESHAQYLKMSKEPTPEMQVYLDKHFPDYPIKHLRQESFETQRKGCAPPRMTKFGAGHKETVKKGQKKNATERHVKDVHDSIAARDLFCRVCRKYYSFSEWKSHLESSEHTTALKTGVSLQPTPLKTTRQKVAIQKSIRGGGEKKKKKKKKKKKPAGRPKGTGRKRV